MVKTLEGDRYALCEKHVIVPFCCSYQVYRYLAGCFGLISGRHCLEYDNFSKLFFATKAEESVAGLWKKQPSNTANHKSETEKWLTSEIFVVSDLLNGNVFFNAHVAQSFQIGIEVFQTFFAGDELNAHLTAIGIDVVA